MLNDKEQRTLEDIERQLGLEDPTLARTLVHGPTEQRGPRRWPYQVAVGALLTLLVVALVFALPVVAFALAVLAGMVLGGQVLHRQWHLRQQGQGGTTS